MCKFWLKSTCKKGAKCSWPHVLEDQRDENREEEAALSLAQTVKSAKGKAAELLPRPRVESRPHAQRTKKVKPALQVDADADAHVLLAGAMALASSM